MQRPHDPDGGREVDPEAGHERSDREGSEHGLSPFFSRRRFLATSGLALAGATLYACTGGGRKNPVVTPTPTRSVTATDTRWPIKRVVYVMLENRSFDNIFGSFPGANGATTGVKFGKEVPLTPSPHWLPGDLPHDRAALLNDVNGGTYDGFGTGQFGDPWAYTTFEEHMVPVYWQLARDYVLCDNFFASVGGPSYPNHFFFVAGQSGGVLDNPENIEVRTDENGAVQELGLRRRRRRRVRPREGRPGQPHEARHVLRLPHGPGAARGDRRELGVLLGEPVPDRVLLERAQRDLRRVPHRPVAARDDPARRPDRGGHPRRASSPPSPGSRRGSSSRTTRPRARASRRTGSPAS